MKTVYDFNGGWRFSKCSAPADPMQLIDGETVTLPHTWYADGDYYQGNAVYQKRFALPPMEGHRVFLRFQGVDKLCTVWLNGKALGSHAGAYTAFAVELTDALRPDDNLLTVQVNNEKGDTVSPLSGDFAVFGGISRAVEIIITCPVCFDLLYHGTPGVIACPQLTPDGQGLLSVTTRTAGEAPAGTIVRCVLTAPTGAMAAEVQRPANGNLTLTVSDPMLWDGAGKAALYTLRAELVVEGQTVDEVTLHTGFRSCRVDPDRGFFLNGRHLKLHGVAKHQDSVGVFSATTSEHWQRDMELIAEIGANAVRFAHYPHQQYLYDACDELGIVAWAEFPLLKLTANDELFENAKTQLTEMILQNLHHPAICFWGIQNEIAMFGEAPYMPPKLRELNGLAHRLDPSRLTTCANLNSVKCDSELNRITDVVCYNVYYGWYYGAMPDHAAFLDEFHRVNPTVPLGISEYGVDCNPIFHTDEPRVNDYSEEFQCIYHETVYPYMAERDFVWGSFVWNMFDFVSTIRNAGGVRARNIKGLVSYDRTVRKDSFYYYKAQWSRVPFVHIAQKRYRNRAAAQITLRGYTNQACVMLTVDGGQRTAAVENGVFRFDNVPLHMGDNTFTVTAGDCADSAVFTRVTEPDPAYVFVDTDPGLNVRNWFVDEVEEARLFPDDAYSIRCTMEELLANSEVMTVIDHMAPPLADIIRGDAILTFTLEQAIRHERPRISEDDVKALNLALNKIPKPQA